MACFGCFLNGLGLQVVRYMARRSPEEQLAHDFSLLDSDGKGYFEAGDLRRIAKTLPSDASVTDSDIATM